MSWRAQARSSWTMEAYTRRQHERHYQSTRQKSGHLKNDVKYRKNPSFIAGMRRETHSRIGRRHVLEPGTMMSRKSAPQYWRPQKLIKKIVNPIVEVQRFTVWTTSGGNSNKPVINSPCWRKFSGGSSPPSSGVFIKNSQVFLTISPVRTNKKKPTPKQNSCLVTPVTS